MRTGRLLFAGFGMLALLACEAPPPRAHVAKATVATGEDVLVAFDDALSGNATNQYWVALQPADAPTSDTSGRILLERTDRAVRLRTSRPGDFEVRFHGRYPKEEHHVLARIPVRVEGWLVKTGIERRWEPEACLDRWLAEQKLDPYGSPEGTAYAGGTPLFDATSGKNLSRWEYVTSKHPIAKELCEHGSSETTP